MFTIQPYPSNVEGRIQWCMNYAEHILIFVEDIYNNDREFDKDSFQYISTFERIQIIFFEMRGIINQVNHYIITNIDPSTLTPYNLEVEPIRSIMNTLQYHERNVTTIYNKWYGRYNTCKEESILLCSRSISTIECTDDEADFQIR